MRRVIIESPYAGNVWQRWLNRRYARRCLRDSCLRNEAPLASHLLYTMALDDASPHERAVGMECGFEWARAADLTAVYIDRGISRGMWEGMDRAVQAMRPIEHRSLDPKIERLLRAGFIGEGMVLRPPRRT